MNSSFIFCKHDYNILSLSLSLSSLSSTNHLYTDDHAQNVETADQTEKSALVVSPPTISTIFGTLK